MSSTINRGYDVATYFIFKKIKRIFTTYANVDSNSLEAPKSLCQSKNKTKSTFRLTKYRDWIKSHSKI